MRKSIIIILLFISANAFAQNTAKEDLYSCLSNSRKANFDRAIKYCTESIEKDPTLTAAYYNRGSAYYAKGNFEKAVDDLKIVDQREPLNFEASTKFKDACFHLKNSIKECEEFKRLENRNISTIVYCDEIIPMPPGCQKRLGH